MRVSLGRMVWLVALPQLACSSARHVAPAKDAGVQVERVDAPSARNDPRGALDIRIGPADEGVVFRDVRNVALAAGVSRVTLSGLPLDFEAGQASVRAPGAKLPLELLEMRPFSAAITPQRLLEPSLGKAVTAYVWDPATNTETAKSATLLGLTEEGPVVAFDGAVRVLTVGRVAVAALPPTLRAEPTVELLVRASVDAPRLELTYTSKLVTAALEYQLVRSQGASNAELIGLVGVSNTSGAALEKARVSLTSDSTETAKFANSAASVSGAPAQTTSLSLPEPLSVAHGERVLVRLFGPREVSLTRRIVFEGHGLPFDGALDDYGNASVHAVLDARVSNGAVLSPHGMIPGRAHLFERATPEAPASAYGTAAARPLPGAMGLRVDLGAWDESKLPSKRRLTQKRNLGRCVSETTWEITLSNPTEEALPVEDVEPVEGKYELLESSMAPIAKEVDHFAFGTSIPPNGEVKLKFRVRTSACAVHRRQYWQPSWGKPSGSSSKGGS